MTQSKLEEALSIADKRGEEVKELDFGNVFWACGVLADAYRSTLSQPDIAEMMAEALKNAQATLKYHGITPLIKVEKALSAYEAAKTNNGWMTIDSAPKDGTCILVYIKSPVTGDAWQDTVAFNDIENMFMSGSRLVGHDFITHWQPLPQPPTRETENE